ncbi:MAG: NADH-quinone oxidoreductase subunit NuoH [Planctomycetota bacterium]
MTLALAAQGARGGLFEGLWGMGPLVSAILGFFVVLGVASVLPMFWTWAERRVAGRIQQRPGPNRVGPFGLIQALADGVKLMVKEDIVPADSSRFLFMLAPAIVLGGTLVAFGMLPLSPSGIIVDTHLGIYLIGAFLALEAIGVIMAGWASNNKWSILGGMREAAQLVSYEVPIGILFLMAGVVYGSLNLADMVHGQEDGAFFGLGGWLVFRMVPFGPIAFLVFYTAILAESKRAPFDLPEAESELVSGFHTEYSGIRFSFFFLSEYAAMFLLSGIAVCIFLGGWNLPLVPGSFWRDHGIVGELLAAASMILKSFVLVFVMLWLRWTLPRIRIDQVMSVCYKYLTPLAFACLLAAAFFVETEA